MKHVAVIGGGVSGLVAAYLLSRRHRVTLYERDGRLGGHAHTVVVEGEGGPLHLDTGFLVHNPEAYPLLVRLFAELGVETTGSDMSFSVSCSATGLEYSSRGLRGFFADRRNRARRAHYQLLGDIVRFNREAPSLLEAPGADGLTLGEFLTRRRYGSEFVIRYLLPMASAIWSSTIEGIDRFPAQTLVRFMQNHGLLAVTRHPAWRVVTGGSHTYVRRLAARMPAEIRLGARLRSIHRDEAGAILRFHDRADERADEVVLACHGDQVLPLLADPTGAEREVFGSFATTRNETWLHTDDRLLPRLPRARASWNYRLGGASDSSPMVTYDLNRLQGLDNPTRYCVTLNPRTPIDPDRVIARVEYRHPRFTVPAIRAQARWPEVSGVNHTHYCGAYWRHGFHEDGVFSAVRVAAALGVAW
jgi:predicted NAD/FAD-binding protein